MIDRGAGQLRLYKNGAQTDSLDISALGSLASNKNAVVGSGAGADWFKGTIDDVMIFDRVLTPAEIAALNP